MAAPARDGSDVDWGWTESAVVPAYYERALAPLSKLPPPQARILEVGVGSGYVLSKLVLQCGGRGFGADYDPNAMALAARVASSFGTSLELVRADGSRLPFADRSFDFVFSQGFIEHFGEEATERLVAEHVRVLRPGGTLALSVPNLYNPFHTWLKWREGAAYRFHPERSYRPKDLAALMSRHGVAVQGRDGYGLLWSLWHQRSRLSYYVSAATLKLGMGHEFEALLPSYVRSLSCSMTLAWGRRPN